MVEDANLKQSQILQKIEQAKAILRDLGLPIAQQNERSALTLLALLDLKSDQSWKEAKNPLRGITPIMDFMALHYAKPYKPNTRETIRRQTVHQFVEAGIVNINPDQPKRPPNSPKTVYQVSENVLALLQTYKTESWTEQLRLYLETAETLSQRYAQERQMQRIPLTIASGQTISLSPGGQNILIEQIVHEFCPRFTPGGQLIYIGDAEEKWSYFVPESLAALGVTIEGHGKMPDLIIYDTLKNWLILIEAVTSHGPINPKRQRELQALFQQSTAGLVFVTAFLHRRDLVRYLGEIAWETEVWVAESPSHMIHFDGERFLGPYS